MDLMSSLIKFEEDEDLFSKAIDGIHYWKLVRSEVFFNLLCKRESSSRARKQFSHYSTANRIIIIGKSLFLNLFRKCKTLFIEFRHNKGQDNLSLSVIRQMKIENYNSVIRPDNKISEKYQEYNILYKILLRYFKAKCKHRYINYSELEIIGERIRRRYPECTIDLCSILKRNLAIFLAQYYTYKTILKRKRVKCLFLVSSGGNEGIIAAARELEVESTEIQHSHVSKGHVGYNYPVGMKNRVPYFPDKFIVFGLFWKEYCPDTFPLHKSNIYVLINESITKYREMSFRREPNSFVVISQYIYTGSLITLTKRLARLLKGYRFYYKLHPGEYGKLRMLAEEVKDFENVCIIAESVDLYSLFRRSTFLIGIDSTAIFEGIQLGCIPIVYKVKGSEIIEDLIDELSIHTCEDAESIAYQINNKQLSKPSNTSIYI